MTDSRRGDCTRCLPSEPDVPRKLRALWALHVIGRLDDEFLVKQLEHESEYVRGLGGSAVVRRSRTAGARRWHGSQKLAKTGDSPLVRLHLASCLQRLPPDERWPIAEALLSQAEDADDANLPLMIWYGIEPLVDDGPRPLCRAGRGGQIPLVRPAHWPPRR